MKPAVPPHRRRITEAVAEHHKNGEPKLQGSMAILKTYRRVAEDGVEVTQCPTKPALGFGFDDEKW